MDLFVKSSFVVASGFAGWVFYRLSTRQLVRNTDNTDYGCVDEIKNLNTVLFARVNENAVIPTRAHSSDAGLDLTACETVHLRPWSRSLVDTGLQVKLPIGTYGRVAPRSGLSIKKSLDVGAGVVDRGYRGVVKVCLINSSSDPVTVLAGERVAQLVIERISECDVKEVASLDDTDRGTGGFGSSGK